jgi:membrane protein YqaA with SNARE-associated domain
MVLHDVSAKETTTDGINLRAWFNGYLAWMIGLAVVTLFGLHKVEAGGGMLVLSVSLFAGYAFYMSLCCTFFPFPTTGAVMFAASGTAASCVGLSNHAVWQLVIVASIGALASGIANLNEYHIFICLLRWRRAAAIRETRLFHWVNDWFRSSPFWILTLFNFIPIPVDFVRWLAISSRYPRRRFLLSTLIGRWVRYAILAASSIGFDLRPWHIAVVQAFLVALALIRSLPWIIGRLRHRRGTDAESSPAAGAADETRPPRTGASDQSPDREGGVGAGIGGTAPSRSRL